MICQHRGLYGLSTDGLHGLFIIKQKWNLTTKRIIELNPQNPLFKGTVYFGIPIVDERDEVVKFLIRPIPNIHHLQLDLLVLLPLLRYTPIRNFSYIHFGKEREVMVLKRSDCYRNSYIPSTMLTRSSV